MESSSLVFQRFLSSNSTCIRLQNDSIIALSKQSPTVPVRGYQLDDLEPPFGQAPSRRTDRRNKRVGHCGGRISPFSPRTRASLPRRPSPYREHPNDPRVLLVKARLLLFASKQTESTPTELERLREVIRLATRAQRWAPTRVEASTLLAQAGLMNEDVVAPSEIKRALTSALALAPYRDDLLYLYLVYLSEFEAPDQARQIAAQLLSRTKDARIRAGIKEVLDELCSNHGDCNAEPTPAPPNAPEVQTRAR